MFDFFARCVNLKKFLHFKEITFGFVNENSLTKKKF